MNKTALKTFATNARKELLKKVEAKAMKIGITENNIKKAEIESSDAVYIGGKQLSKEDRIQRDRLINRIKQIGFTRVMEEVAYTWFNRFTALRFMEVNDYLPTGVRVLSSTNPDSADPDIINDALSLDLEIDKEYVYDLKINNKTEELFKYLIIKQCNDLNRYLPFMFETIDDYTEILFPEGLLAKDSFVRQMTDIVEIPEGNWNKIEVIGWLYQYYIAEEKDRVFKQKKKFRSEEIPFATQLFTPDWIVRYMVQNSLGRYWIESHPEHKDLIGNWEFYLENRNSESYFGEKHAPYINKELRVEDLKCFDPAMGSGHILVYMFDVLYEIYSKCGYTDREIPRLIIENNLYGLDIDDRAYQLACFSVVMKALEYNSRFFRSIEREGICLNLASIKETNIFNAHEITYIAGENFGPEFELVKEFIGQFKDAKTVGSLINVHKFEKEFFKQRLDLIQNNPAKDFFEEEVKIKVLGLLPDLLKQAEIMYQQYDILVTNPPYMGSANMNEILSNFLRQHYPDSKSDLFAPFMELDQYLKKDGFYASINQHAWMFLSSFEKLREKIIQNKSISTMLHLGPRAFEEIGGEVVQSTAFVLRNNYIPSVDGIYIRLVNERTAKEKREKTLFAIEQPSVPYRYSFNQKNLGKIPGRPIAYWAKEEIYASFEHKSLADIGYSFQGIITGNVEKYLKLWHEISLNNIKFNESNPNKLIHMNCYIPYIKGGEYRRWYGNLSYVLFWTNNGKNLTRSRTENRDYFFREGITWSLITSSKLSFRWFDNGFLCDVSGSSYYVENPKYSTFFILAFLNSKVSEEIIRIINPTLNLNIKDVLLMPIIESKDTESRIEQLVKQNIEISKNDWNSYESSWDFKEHPILEFRSNDGLISNSFNNWSDYTNSQFHQLQINEEQINSFFINIYGLEKELSPDIAEEDLTLQKAELKRDIQSFISYAIGCMFGRYSLDERGLVFAGEGFSPERYIKFQVDNDNILPILPGTYFEDDILSRLIEFVKVTFGEETLLENLEFIAETLGKKKGETAKETIRRYFINDFFKDHVQTYKKKPIYWLFTSGKQKAFNCLIYMHRYDKSTLSRIRTDYLHEYQIRLEGERKLLINIIEGDSTSKEISNAKKDLKELDKKIDELKEYDELLHHMADMQIELDLNEGVSVNYEKLKGLVAKI